MLSHCWSQTPTPIFLTNCDHTPWPYIIICFHSNTQWCQSITYFICSSNSSTEWCQSVSSAVNSLQLNFMATSQISPWHPNTTLFSQPSNFKCSSSVTQFLKLLPLVVELFENLCATLPDYRLVGLPLQVANTICCCKYRMSHTCENCYTLIW